MRKKKIFTPIVAVGLAMSLSVGSEVDIEIWTTQIENFHFSQFSDASTYIDRYFYAPQNGSEELLDSFTLSFANRPTANQLTLQKTGNGSGTLALGGANSVNFTSGAGVWISEFSIDFARSDITSSKQISLIFGYGYISSLSPYDSYNGNKTTFNILNGYNRNDTLEVLFTGSTNSDFTINSSSTNTITFSKAYDGTTIENIGDITISGSDSKNIFNFEDITYRGTFTNAISTDTQINLNSSTTQFIGDINTTGGGITTINILASGTTLQGNILADNGKNLLELSSNTTSLTLSSTFTANSSGINQINFSNTSPLTITSENGLVLNGNATYESGGGNILVGDNNQSFSLQNSQGEEQAITTQSGITKIDSISFEGNIQTSGGITLFGDFDSNGNDTRIEGNIIANGGNNIISNTSIYGNQWLAYGNSKNIFYSSDNTWIARKTLGSNGEDEIQLGGDNNGENIFYINDDEAIRIYTYEYTPLYIDGTIQTIGGTSKIIFTGSQGRFEGKVVADGGNNEIIFEQSGDFYLGELLWAKDTSTNTMQVQKNVSIIRKELRTNNSSGGNIINIENGAKLTIINDDTTSYQTNLPSGQYIVSTGGGKNILRFEGTSGGFSGSIIARGADNDIVFSQNGTFDISGGDILDGNYNTIFLASYSNNNFLIGNNSVIISTVFSALSECNASNSFIIGSGGSLTFSQSASLHAEENNNGSANFTIGDGGSLNFTNGGEKTSLILKGGGKTNIEFDNYGSLSGNIQTQSGTNTLYFKNSNKGVSPHAILDASFEATNYGTNVISINTNGTILKSNNGLQFSSSQGGKNRVELLGDGVSLTLQNVSDSQTQTLNSNGVSEVHFVGANQTFNGNILSRSGTSTITLGGVDNSSNAIVGKATINGNITADGGNNTFSFLYDSSTLSMGAGSQIIANSTSTNTFTIDKNITFLTDLTLSGNATDNGGNIINIGSGKTLALLTSTEVLASVITSGGTTSINFNGDQSKLKAIVSTTTNGANTNINFHNDGSISGGVSTSDGKTNIEIWNASATLYNIPSENYALKTTGGSASIDFKETLGSFSGNLLANGGSNTITFAKDGTFDFNSTLSTDSTSTNTFTIDKNITLSNNLSIDGIGSNNAGTIPQQAYGTFFNIAGGSSLTLSNNGEKTSITTNGNGATTLAFQGNSGSFSGKLIANFSSKSGKNLISFTQSGSFGFDAILDAQQGYNRMEISQDITITTDIYATGASDESVDKGNSFIIDNTKSLILNSNNSKKTIYTQGGETTLSFQKTGSFSGNLNTTNGLLELDFKTMETGDYTIDLDTDFYAGANGENRIRFYDSTRNLILRSEGGFSFRGEGNGNNSIFIGSSGTKFTFTDKSSAIQTLTYNGGENTITFANTGQILEANILNTQGNLTFVFGSNEKGITIGQATINGNITADGGNNTFSFLYDSSTLSMGASSQIIANTTSANTFTIDKNITFLTDLTLSGNATDNGGNIFNISGGKDLILQDSSSAIKTLYTTGGQSKITFEGSGNLVANLSTSGGVATATFGGESTSVNLQNIVANGGNNIINLGANVSTLTISPSKSMSATQGSNTINVESKNLTLSGSITSSSGQNHINLNTSDGILNLSSATFSTSSDKNNHIHLKNSGIFIITTSSANTNHLTFDLDSDGAKLNFGGDLSTIGTAINFNANNTTLISNITTTAGTTTLTLNSPKSRDAWREMSAYIEGKITTSKGAETNLVFSSSNQRLILKDDAQITNITHQANNGISFYHTSRSSTEFKTLTIGSKDSASGISGSGLSFVVYAKSNESKEKAGSQVYADKVIIHSSSNNEVSTHTLGVVFENQDTLNLDAISYTKGADNNILIASVSDSSKVNFNTQSTQVLGFDVAKIDYVTESTDENGNTSGSGYTSYFVGKAKATEVIEAEQEITATAFTLNYDLYMANLNSLNKRMGELRENNHSQGVWARVFNGALSNEFGLGSKSNYTTIQAGYDYAFGFEGANNYLGVALSYALSTSTSDNKAFDSNGEQRGIDNIYSNAVEVALYNSYVSDRGWYNDSIAKFSYLMSSFEISNFNSGSITSNDTSNFALTLSDEVGYVFKLGESKEWSITPQVEATFGYFNQSDFKQTLANSTAYLDSMAESVLTLRTRIGSAFGYDFKKFTQKDTFNASLYVGAFYEYDYVSGGEIKMSTQRETQTNKYSNLSSDGRVVVNVGTNMSIKDNTRIYFDFEKSFAGKINTDYQVNVGVRYSFGESDGYSPILEKADYKAPLKIEGEEDKEGEESKEGDNKEKEEQESNEIKEKKQEQKEAEAREDSTSQE
ncbi:autotransporter outer membrane beta-barrel domain-containing protein [Helicobacter brantae]|uniref:Autotransporter domain-containing protein n=1 Tax=Helicobacter brantae TaxID=375927 RepID=A0A3D8J2A1_9HELI|nr:autotransporter outer membrane beta-barrel domain-containing protein [Helicobacter brantae]RDU70984.1 hypothetical protein CQA58_04180 [Helicobacter brantae]